MRIIAIDDEPIALNIIERYCERRGGIELETYSQPRIGMQRILECPPEVVMLDIELNGKSGIELARQVPQSSCLIFTTAYAHYALDGFEVNAVDFLHKPYFYERFDRALQKAEQFLHMHDLLRSSESAGRQIILKSEYKKLSISIDSIIYIESIDNYVRVHLADSTSLLSKMPLRSIEEQLPKEEFLRIHRSYLVSRSRIGSFSRSEITLAKDGKPLPIGKTYLEEVIRQLKG